MSMRKKNQELNEIVTQQRFDLDNKTKENQELQDSLRELEVDIANFQQQLKDNFNDCKVKFQQQLNERDERERKLSFEVEKHFQESKSLKEQKAQLLKTLQEEKSRCLDLQKDLEQHKNQLQQSQRSFI